MRRSPIDDCELHIERSGVDVIELQDALEHLERLSPEQAESIRLRHIVGLTLEETVALTGRPISRIRNELANGLAFLRLHVEGG